MSEFNDIVTEKEKAINAEFLNGWSWADYCMNKVGIAIHNSDIDKFYKYSKYSGVGFETGVCHYERTNLDEPEASDLWWLEFNKNV